MEHYPAISAGTGRVSGAGSWAHRLDRRRFLRGVAGFSLGAASLGGLAACRQPAARPASKRLPLFGYFDNPSDEGKPPKLPPTLLEGLAVLGYREGVTINIERRFATDVDPSRWDDVARELVDLHPDVICVSRGTLPNVLTHTRAIPIVVEAPVASVEELIAGGFIKSQAHPGGNVTGLVGSSATLWGKCLDLLKETVPGATRVGVLRDPRAPDPLASPPPWVSEAVPMPVSRPADLDAAFAAAEQNQVEVLAVSAVYTIAYLNKIAEQTRRHRLPAICENAFFAQRGGLMSYGADIPAIFGNVGRFVDKILKGASPANLPVELATTFRFVINQATANELGLTIPPAVLAQATEVLQ